MVFPAIKTGHNNESKKLTKTETRISTGEMTKSRQNLIS